MSGDVGAILQARYLTSRKVILLDQSRQICTSLLAIGSKGGEFGSTRGIVWGGRVPHFWYCFAVSPNPLHSITMKVPRNMKNRNRVRRKMERIERRGGIRSLEPLRLNPLKASIVMIVVHYPALSGNLAHVNQAWMRSSSLPRVSQAPFVAVCISCLLLPWSRS